MPDTLFSPSWYRVAGLRPRLRRHLEIHRHHYRGELWYVLQDHSSGRFQRFNPTAYVLIGLMNGKRTVQEIWEAGRVRLGEDAPTQEEVIHLLSQLHSVDALQSDVLPDTAEMLKRFEKQQHKKLKQNLRSPLFMQFPLLDPERLLTMCLPFARFIFGWIGVLVWLAVVGYAVFLVGVHWGELTENVTDRVLAFQNLFIIWLTFPFLKAFHEFGHAFAVKKGGGEVHEMGVMLLVFTPIPYVDASAASAFRSKRERVLVGAAGMMVEVLFAALAVLLWVNVEPGTVRSIAYNTIIIAGVSTLLFNGNPLLRYDAYYMLSDLLEIPNLGPRGIRYVLYLLQRYAFGMRDEEPPYSTPGERVWFVIYTIASFLYRIAIYTGIILFVASRFLGVGIVIACWGMFNMFILPLGKGLHFLWTSPKLRRKRTFAVAVVVFAAAGVIAVVLLAPVPLGTLAEGVIWIPEASYVRAGTDGFIDRLVVEPGSSVKTGDPLVQCFDPLLPAHIRVLEARLRELKATYDSQFISNRVAAKITQEEIRQVSAELEDARQRVDDLTIRSGSDGVFIAPMAQDLPGRFLRRGELVGYVLDDSATIARVVVSQADVDLVRRRTLGVQVRFPENVVNAFPATLLREAPAATDELPSPTLSLAGGGRIAIDPSDPRGMKTFEKMFLFDIELPTPADLYRVGGRVYARFDHGTEPLLWRWYRGARRLFLRRFSL